MITAINKMEGTLGRLEATLTSLQGQLGRVETKLGEVEREVAGHGKWMHTLKVFAGLMSVFIGWVFLNAVWPWLKSKLGIP
ncbi:MAG: hypothetical protein LH467_03985 [Gemmatimonadaceae bacterium]|nr:hypothetical protein [Gemmatimonadaceae bacterium]